MTQDDHPKDQTTTSGVAYLRTGGGFSDVQLPVPAPDAHDLLVDVRAVSVNPVDVKVRASSDPGGTPKVLGWDAAGVVVGVGSEVTAFAVGDEVYYAGVISRPGTDAHLHLVDERITGHKPATLDFAEAAALPLTSITAWESLFERLSVDRDRPGTLLVVGGAGGVGSMVVQLASRLTELRVIATASRPESAGWTREMGAHDIIDRRDLVEQVHQLAPDGVDAIFSAYSTGNVEAYADVLKVHGAVVAIDDPQGLDLFPLKEKAQTWHWESMFARPLYQPDSTAQRELLDEVSRLVDAGVLRTTLTTRLSGLNAATLTWAHQLVETSSTIGKVVVTVA